MFELWVNQGLPPKSSEAWCFFRASMVLGADRFAPMQAVTTGRRGFSIQILVQVLLYTNQAIIQMRCITLLDLHHPVTTQLLIWRLRKKPAVLPGTSITSHYLDAHLGFR